MAALIIITLNRPQTCAIGILTNHRWERPVVLNLGHLDFEIVSDFDIRISDFRLSAPLSLFSFLPSCLRGQRQPSTLVETPLQISLFSAKQSQFQNGQYKHKYSKNKDLCQPTTNNEQQTLSKTNPIKPNRTQFLPSQNDRKPNLN